MSTAQRLRTVTLTDIIYDATGNPLAGEVVTALLSGLTAAITYKNASNTSDVANGDTIVKTTVSATTAGSAPGTIPTVAAVTIDSRVDVGSHVWSVSFVTGTVESAASANSASQSTTSSQGVTVTLPLGPAGTTSRRLYRSRLSDVIAAMTSYNNHSGNVTSVVAKMYFIAIPVPTGRRVASLTLPAAVGGGSLHVFAVSTGNGAESNNLASSFTNIGITDNASSGSGAFQGVLSFSKQALAANSPALATSGTPTLSGISVKLGAAFASGSADNAIANGQSVTITSGSTSGFIGFLVAASGGLTAQGNGVLTFDDASTQSYQLTVPDWQGSDITAGQLLLTELLDNTTTTYTDIKSDSSLTQGEFPLVVGQYAINLIAPGDMLPNTGYYSISEAGIVTPTTAFAFQADTLQAATAFNSVPASAPVTVAMTGYILSPSGAPVAGQQVVAYLSSNATDIATGVTVSSAQPATGTTDTNGFYSLSLVPNANLNNPTGTYYTVNEGSSGITKTILAVAGGGTVNANLTTPVSAVGGTVLPASSSVLGLVKVGSNIAVTADGIISILQPMTRIGSVVVTVAQAAITISSIPAIYRHLRLVIVGRSTTAATSALVKLTLNNITTAHYNDARANILTATLTGDQLAAQAAMRIGYVSGASSPSGYRSIITADLLDYNDTTYPKVVKSECAIMQDGSNISFNLFGGILSDITAYTRIDLATVGNFDVGTEVSLYGMP